MTYDQIKTASLTYFSSFGRLFGEVPKFPSQEESDSALASIERVISDGLKTYGNDPALKHIIEIDVLDKMEEIINSYK